LKSFFIGLSVLIYGISLPPSLPAQAFIAPPAQTKIIIMILILFPPAQQEIPQGAQLQIQRG
jgi:hypothetical protein